MMLWWICLGLFFAYFIVYETIWGLRAYPKILAGILDGSLERRSLYRRMMAGLWLPTLLVGLLVALGRISLADLGLRGPAIRGPAWLSYSAAALALLYFAYLCYCLVALRVNAAKGLSLSQPLPPEIKALLPLTRKEKGLWVLTALTAGVTEELLFRGFLFYLLGALFPALPLAAILGISTLAFGIGHLYQGPAEAIKPMLLGAVFGAFYLSFGTILPCILLHAMQDLCVVDMINEES
jgi:membrane protease YdiL (CAAX protease family)